MTIKRWLLGATAAVGLAGSAAGQGTVSPWPGSEAPPADWFQKADAPAVMSTAVQPAAADVLTAPAGQPVSAPMGALPPGSVGSPWCGSGPAGSGCCGPVGGNGPLTYELYSRTGPGIVWGSELARTLRPGWQVGAGTRVLLFNQNADAAWALIAGMTYHYNRGSSDKFLDIGTPNDIPIRDATGAQVGVERGPDLITKQRIRSFHRTSFDFGIGRDWWLTSTGALPGGGTGWRVGTDIGGRWGTGHVESVPDEDRRNYTRRGDIFHALWYGVHADWERNMGAWILHGGFRAEYDITWANMVPPRSGDVQGVNFLLTLGVRF